MFFFVLMLVVYSNSKFLTMTFLSLYGAVYGMARASNRINAMTSLLHYGSEVLQHGL
ncbi:MAG: hypothetical protein NWF05_11065 [Candidatus Bathyarchaeota archaeon]|nr:hypothetical protein [Candidatus Bathyarchaeota archaeon]